MINAENYFDKIKGVDLSTLPESLQNGHQYLLKATGSGSDWVAYKSSEKIKGAIDTYFEKLSEFLSKKKGTESKPKSAPKSKPVTPKTEQVVKKKTPTPKAKRKEVEEDISLVEKLPEELRFIKRYVSLHDKVKGKDDLLPFIKSLQKAIIEKKIRKTSPYASQIESIQDKLLEAYNKIKKPIKILIADKVLNEYKQLISQEQVMPSVKLIKRYISLNGKDGEWEKARLLLESMKKAVSKGLISKSDKYWPLLDRMFKNIQDVVDGEKSTLEITTSELNGLNGMLAGCGCSVHRTEELSGIGELPEEPVVMNSIDFANLHFPTIGFTGKYLDFIGDPAPGFSVMVYGKPKMGKSFLCIDFANYLSENHGRVLYVAKEEGLYTTLQKKINEAKAKNLNLDVANGILSNLEGYDFVFLDSVNMLELSDTDLRNLRRKYPKISFIYVFQTTKGGNFRGVNTFQHDVDAIIEVPQVGLAIQHGRFNQGGEMNFYDDSIN